MGPALWPIAVIVANIKPRICDCDAMKQAYKMVVFGPLILLSQYNELSLSQWRWTDVLAYGNIDPVRPRGVH